MGSKAGADFERIVAANAYTRWHNATMLAMVLRADETSNPGHHAVLMGEVKESAQDFIEALTQMVENGNGAHVTVDGVCEIRQILTPDDTDQLLGDLMSKL